MRQVTLQGVLEVINFKWLFSISRNVMSMCLVFKFKDRCSGGVEKEAVANWSKHDFQLVPRRFDNFWGTRLADLKPLAENGRRGQDFFLQ